MTIIILSAIGILLLGSGYYWVNYLYAEKLEIRRRKATARPKLSDWQIGQAVYVKGKKEAGVRKVMTRLLTCDAVTIDLPVDGLQVFDSDQLEAE